MINFKHSLLPVTHSTCVNVYLEIRVPHKCPTTQTARFDSFYNTEVQKQSTKETKFSIQVFKFNKKNIHKPAWCHGKFEGAYSLE